MGVLGRCRQRHVKLDRFRSRDRSRVGQRERGGDVHIPVNVSDLGEFEVRVLERRVGQPMARIA